MNRAFTRFLPFLLVMVCGSCRHHLPPATGSLAPEAAALKGVVAVADRLVVYENRTAVARALPLAVGAAVVAAAAKRQSVYIGFQCLCYADWVVIWYRGDTPVTAVGIQTNRVLSWTAGPVDGDLELDEDTHARLLGELLPAWDAAAPIPGYRPPAF